MVDIPTISLSVSCDTSIDFFSNISSNLLGCSGCAGVRLSPVILVVPFILPRRLLPRTEEVAEAFFAALFKVLDPWRLVDGSLFWSDGESDLIVVSAALVRQEGSSPEEERT